VKADKGQSPVIHFCRQNPVVPQRTLHKRSTAWMMSFTQISPQEEVKS